MDDRAIIELFLRRDERAIHEVQGKYRPLLYRIARNIAGTAQDAEECLSDTYLQLWGAIPPENPVSLRNYAARIVRNRAIDRYRKSASGAGRGQAAEVCAELAEAFQDVRDGYEEAYLKGLLNGFLDALDQETRVLFVRRYWLSESIRDLARSSGKKESAIKMRLLRTREKLREHLQEGGYPL